MSWSADHLTVRFGDRVALDDVSLAVEPGAIHAVIGGDGAGKSTLLKVFAGLDVGQEGTVRLPGPGRIGFVPTQGGIFDDMTVDENLSFVASAYRLRGWRDRAAELLRRADLAPFGDRVSGRMSGGQRRKLAGCMALLPRPELLVLDEVTTGVDPVSRMELWRMVTAAAADGAAVVAATTYLDEAERMEHVLLLHDGRVLGSGSPDQVVAGVDGHVYSLDERPDSEAAWRHGRHWRMWSAAPVPERQPVPLTLEDAAIVLEMQATAGVAR